MVFKETIRQRKQYLTPPVWELTRNPYWSEDMFETQATPSSIPDLIDVSAKPRGYIFSFIYFFLINFNLAINLKLCLILGFQEIFHAVLTLFLKLR